MDIGTLQTPGAVREAYRKSLLNHAVLYAIERHAVEQSWDILTCLQLQVVAPARQKEEMLQEITRLRLSTPVVLPFVPSPEEG